MKKIFFSIRQKLLLTYILVGIIPLIVLSTLVMQLYLSYMQAESLQGLRISTNDAVQYIDDSFYDYRSEMTRLVFTYELEKLFLENDESNERLSLVLYDIMPEIRLVESLDTSLSEIKILADADFESDLIKKHYYFNGVELYEETMNNNSVVITNENQIVYSKKYDLINASDKSIVIVFFINKKLFFYEMQQSFNEIGLIVESGKDNVNFVNTPDGQRSDNSLNTYNVQFNNNVVAFDGTEYLSFTEKTNAVNWTVHCYTNNVNHFQRDQLTIVIVVISIVLVIIIILSFILSKGITAPIINLNSTIRKISSCNYKIKSSSRSNDEFGQLEDSFIDLMNRLKIGKETELMQEIALKESHLASLYSKISPHFLYNTLNTIKMKSLMNQSEDIGQLVTSLADFYRTALNSGNPTISIEDELINLKAYFDIQLMMYKDSFKVIYDIDCALLKHTIANFVLQPLAENAIEHGIDTVSDEGVIIISCKQQDDDILFSIEDNGYGFDDEFDIFDNKPGYGIKNVDERIKLLFGDECGVIFGKSQKLSGACVTIKIKKTTVK